MVGNFGFETSEFDALIQRFEQLGVGADEIANIVLNGVSEDARAIFASNVPRSESGTDHAADHVIVSGTKTSRRGNQYRLIGAAERKGSGMNWEPYRYLFYIENGTSKMVAKPFTDKAHAAIATAIQPKMIDIMNDQLRRRIGTE